jgi:hypothetical protein
MKKPIVKKDRKQVKLSLPFAHTISYENGEEQRAIDIYQNKSMIEVEREFDVKWIDLFIYLFHTPHN